MQLCAEEEEEQHKKQQQQHKSITNIVPKCFAYSLLWNVHLDLGVDPPTKSGTTYSTRGDFAYFHYDCDDGSFKDAGWGCAYRTLQSICSWILCKRDQDKATALSHCPSLQEIQEVLVQIGDKPENFLGSRDWIGALEVFYVVDALFDVSCKIVHVQSNEDLKKYANVLKKYFEDFGGLVMMGGDVDAASKGIAGVHISNNQAYFLVIDPHFVGKPKSIQELFEKGYIRWQHTSEFVDSSFYNLCLPQLK